MAKPDSARLRRNMSALVNLAKFREEKLADYVEGQRAAEELQQRIWELDDQKKSLVRPPPSCQSAEEVSVRSPPSGQSEEVSAALSSLWPGQQTAEMPFPYAMKALNHSSGRRAYMCLGSAAQRRC